MKISTHINRYSPESYLTITITVSRAETVSFTEVASEVERAVAEANKQTRRSALAPFPRKGER